MTKPLLLACALAAAGLLAADTIRTTSGDVLNGTITGIKGGKVVIDTAFAGPLAIDQADIASMDYASETPMFARTDASSRDKDEVRVSRDAEGNPVLIPTADKTRALALEEVATLWDPAEDDPDFPPVKLWAFSASLGLTGTSGSSRDVSTSIYLDAVRTSEKTTFKAYASMYKTRSDGVASAERYIGGLDFEHRPYEYASWYLRDEAQHNRFNDYKLRNVAGAGYGLYLWNTVTDGRASLLRFRVGLAHTYNNRYSKKWPATTVRDTVHDSDVALDLGLLFHYDFVCGVQWNTELTYTPILDDFDNGTLVHESKLSYLMKDLGVVPALNDVSLEAGVRNEYQTRPQPGLCHTETTWYLRLKKTW